MAPHRMNTKRELDEWWHGYATGVFTCLAILALVLAVVTT